MWLGKEADFGTVRSDFNTLERLYIITSIQYWTLLLLLFPNISNPPQITRFRKRLPPIRSSIHILRIVLELLMALTLWPKYWQRKLQHIETERDSYLRMSWLAVIWIL